ncbi:MAG TPA: hypothetical protein VF774_20875 [Pseudoduganella sp.]
MSDDLPIEDIADELFDLTNNPGRQQEREQKYGRGRSLSVGDIVKVGTTPAVPERRLCPESVDASSNLTYAVVALIRQAKQPKILRYL